MKMRNLILKFAVVAAAVVFAVSCAKDGKPSQDANTGVYVLNNGSFGKNNANICRYDVASGKVSADAFALANDGLGLGDTAQDIIAVGDEIYISVNVSQVIFVTDRDLKVKKTITVEAGGNILSPRYLCYAGGKVYVTYYEGFLGEINPSDHSVSITPVGPNPDMLAFHDGKIYTADSGGYLETPNNSISVVDVATFKRTGEIAVNNNPTAMAVSAGKLFVFSFGIYGVSPAKLQAIDLSAAKPEAKDLDYSDVTGIAARGNTLYVLCSGHDENWTPLPAKVYKYDAAAGKKDGEFVTDGTVIPQGYSISVSDNYLWVGNSDYVNNGDVYAFDLSSGKLVAKFDCGGLNPLKVIE